MPELPNNISQNCSYPVMALDLPNFNIALLFFQGLAAGGRVYRMMSITIARYILSMRLEPSDLQSSLNKHSDCSYIVLTSGILLLCFAQEEIFAI